jgi:hypothetical protein
MNKCIDKSANHQQVAPRENLHYFLHRLAELSEGNDRKPNEKSQISDEQIAEHQTQNGTVQ